MFIVIALTLLITGASIWVHSKLTENRKIGPLIKRHAFFAAGLVFLISGLVFSSSRKGPGILFYVAIGVAIPFLYRAVGNLFRSIIDEGEDRGGSILPMGLDALTAFFLSGVVFLNLFLEDSVIESIRNPAYLVGFAILIAGFFYRVVGFALYCFNYINQGKTRKSIKVVFFGLWVYLAPDLIKVIDVLFS